jgi:hypothetical protein
MDTVSREWMKKGNCKGKQFGVALLQGSNGLGLKIFLLLVLRRWFASRGGCVGGLNTHERYTRGKGRKEGCCEIAHLFLSAISHDDASSSLTKFFCDLLAGSSSPLE